MTNNRIFLDKNGKVAFKQDEIVVNSHEVHFEYVPVITSVGYWVVGGGAGGGYYEDYQGGGSGGGGGGQVISGVTSLSGTYNMTIGSGGGANTDGDDTIVSGLITAAGGGAGAMGINGIGGDGGDYGDGSSGCLGYDYELTERYSSGGGGQSYSGNCTNGITRVGGDGGDAAFQYGSPISDFVTVLCGAGGGGGGYNIGGDGGYAGVDRVGGRGASHLTPRNATNGAYGYGSGNWGSIQGGNGGGGGFSDQYGPYYTAGSGSKGIVLFWYYGSQQATGGDRTWSYNGKFYHIFSVDGTLTITG